MLKANQHTRGIFGTRPVCGGERVSFLLKFVLLPNGKEALYCGESAGTTVSKDESTACAVDSAPDDDLKLSGKTDSEDSDYHPPALSDRYLLINSVLFVVKFM